jgi:hypothetical protein
MGASELFPEGGSESSGIWLYLNLKIVEHNLRNQALIDPPESKNAIEICTKPPTLAEDTACSASSR